MVAIISLLVVVSLSILVTRVATIALTHTGISRETARFQARSAFTGAGFTTSESERVVMHPVRRRIIMLLMLLGNAGLITAVSSLILTFVSPVESGMLGRRLVLLFAGLVLLWIVGTSEWVDKHLSRLIDRMLRRYTRLEVRDYANLIHLAEDYRLVELLVTEGDWLCGKTLAEARLRDEGLVVLGIERANGTYVGVPTGEVRIEAEDTLVIYGREALLNDLDERRADREGDRRHRRAVARQQTAPAEPDLPIDDDAERKS